VTFHDHTGAQSASADESKQTMELQLNILGQFVEVKVGDYANFINSNITVTGQFFFNNDWAKCLYWT